MISESMRRWALVVLLMLTILLSYVDRFAVSVLIAPINAELQISDAQFGLLNGVAFGLFYAAMGLPLGWLADRWSRRGTIILGMPIWSTCTALCAASSTFTQLLIIRIGVGAGEAALAPAAWGILYDRFPRETVGRAISLFQVGSTMGAGFAILVVGAIYAHLTNRSWQLPLISELAPWKQTFILIALPGVLFIAAIAFIKDSKGPVSTTSTTLIAAVPRQPRGPAADMARRLGDEDHARSSASIAAP